MSEGCPPEPAGGPLEAAGNGSPREMAATGKPQGAPATEPGLQATSSASPPLTCGGASTGRRWAIPGPFRRRTPCPGPESTAVRVASSCSTVVVILVGHGRPALRFRRILLRSWSCRCDPRRAWSSGAARRWVVPRGPFRRCDPRRAWSSGAALSEDVERVGGGEVVILAGRGRPALLARDAGLAGLGETVVILAGRGRPALQATGYRQRRAPGTVVILAGRGRPALPLLALVDGEISGDVVILAGRGRPALQAAATDIPPPTARL
ncbi:hypothetical protein FAIPA1_20027 [Frankia sp. AiPs1]